MDKNNPIRIPLIKMERLFTRKLIVWNFVILVLIKVVFSYSGLQIATVLEQVDLFGSRDIVAETNVARSANNLPPLEANARLDLAAEEKLKDMAERGYFAHISPEGTTPWFWIKKNAYDYIYAGENLAVGFVDAKEAVGAWLNSSSHRANLLNPNYREIGVAVGKVDNVDGYSGVLVVQMFGRPVVQTAFASTETQNDSEESEGAKERVAAGAITPTPSPTLMPSPAIEPILAGPVKLQYVSTDDNIAPVGGPIEIEGAVGSQFNINSVSDSANKAFAIYALAIAVISVLFVIFVDRSKKYAMGAAFNIALMVLAAALPVVHATIKAGIV